MVTVAYRQRQNISTLLVLSMLFSLWVAVAPIQASLLGSVGKVAKTIFVNGGAVAAGVFGGAVGAALGGGPLGMAAGAIGGFYLGKKTLEWTTSSTANFATVAGAIAGGALCLGMGFPMLAVGVIGGGLIARLAATGISKLFGKKTPMVMESQVNSDAAAKESAAAAAWLDQLNKKSDQSVAAPAKTETVKKAEPVQSTPEVKDSQAAYDRYTAAYKNYMTATQKGDATLAQSAYADYKKYLALYNSYIKSGK